LTDLGSLADDILVDTLLMEIAGLLGQLVEHGKDGSIDLRAMPLSPACIASLEQRLGHGEVTAVVQAAGRSDIRETGIPGVWWSRHEDEAGRLIALLIDIADVPPLLRTARADMVRGLQRLPDRTHVAAHAASHPRVVAGQ
jgi:hydrogenase-1 operon protein HyaF